MKEITSKTYNKKQTSQSYSKVNKKNKKYKDLKNNLTVFESKTPLIGPHKNRLDMTETYGIHEYRRFKELFKVICKIFT